MKLTTEQQMAERAGEIFDEFKDNQELRDLRHRWEEEKSYGDFKDYQDAVLEIFEGYNVTDIKRTFKIHIVEGNVEHRFGVNLRSVNIRSKTFARPITNKPMKRSKKPSKLKVLNTTVLDMENGDKFTLVETEVPEGGVVVLSEHTLRSMTYQDLAQRYTTDTGNSFIGKSKEAIIQELIKL